MQQQQTLFNAKHQQKQSDAACKKDKNVSSEVSRTHHSN